jgi:3-isopropylmalate/(R)-2-methylmalate dehydratase small subunit
MEPVHQVIGTGVPLDRADVDTDQIIPAEWLKRVERTGFGEGLFSAWRKSSDFVLNQSRYDGASVLVAGPNFGCGSSREHAPWALEDYGFRAIIAPSFADIFRGNCLKIGLLPVTLPAETVERLMRALDDDPSVEIVVDVERRRVEAPAAGIDEEFPLDDFTQFRLLNGLDDIGLTLQHVDQITEHESGRPGHLPSLDHTA